MHASVSASPSPPMRVRTISSRGHGGCMVGRLACACAPLLSSAAAMRAMRAFLALLLLSCVVCMSSAHFSAHPLSKVHMHAMSAPSTPHAGTIRIDEPVLNGTGSWSTVSWTNMPSVFPGNQDWIGVWRYIYNAHTHKEGQANSHTTCSWHGPVRGPGAGCVATAHARALCMRACALCAFSLTHPCLRVRVLLSACAVRSRPTTPR